MGQRSHLAIAYPTTDTDTAPGRIVRYFHWNWGPFMLIRAGQAAHYLSAAVASGLMGYAHRLPEVSRGACVSFCVNQTTGDVQGLAGADDDSAYPASEWDNNDGVFVVDITGDENVPFTFGFFLRRYEAADGFVAATAAEYAAAYQVATGGGVDNEDPVAVAAAEAVEYLTGLESCGYRMDSARAWEIVTSRG